MSVCVFSSGWWAISEERPGLSPVGSDQTTAASSAATIRVFIPQRELGVWGGACHATACGTTGNHDNLFFFLSCRTGSIRSCCTLRLTGCFLKVNMHTVIWGVIRCLSSFEHVGPRTVISCSCFHFFIRLKLQWLLSYYFIYNTFWSGCYFKFLLTGSLCTMFPSALIPPFPNINISLTP